MRRANQIAQLATDQPTVVQRMFPHYQLVPDPKVRLIGRPHLDQFQPFNQLNPRRNALRNRNRMAQPPQMPISTPPRQGRRQLPMAFDLEVPQRLQGAGELQLAFPVAQAEPLTHIPG